MIDFLHRFSNNVQLHGRVDHPPKSTIVTPRKDCDKNWATQWIQTAIGTPSDTFLTKEGKVTTSTLQNCFSMHHN